MCEPLSEGPVQPQPLRLDVRVLAAAAEQCERQVPAGRGKDRQPV